MGKKSKMRKCKKIHASSKCVKPVDLMYTFLEKFVLGKPPQQIASKPLLSSWWQDACFLRFIFFHDFFGVSVSCFPVFVFRVFLSFDLFVFFVFFVFFVLFFFMIFSVFLFPVFLFSFFAFFCVLIFFSFFCVFCCC